MEVQKNTTPLVDELYHQYYPNQFKNTKSLKYYLPKNSKVKLKLFSSIGEKKQEPFNKVENAGTYEIR